MKVLRRNVIIDPLLGKHPRPDDAERPAGSQRANRNECAADRMAQGKPQKP
jgi:hypothetical protein